MKKLAAIAVCIATLFFGVGVAGATKPNPEHKVGICHTMANSKKYVYIEVDIASLYERGHHNHERDVIPPFEDFPGKNWPEGKELLDNKCVVFRPSTTIDETTTTEGYVPPTIIEQTEITSVETVVVTAQPKFTG